GRHLRGLRDRRGRARAASPARADERDRGQDRHAGGRLHARAPPGRARDPARRRARRGAGERHDHRRRRRRHERRLHRDRDGGGRVRLRHQHRPPARARHRLRRARLDGLLLDPLDRGAAAGHGPRDRRRAGPRGARAPRHQALAAGADEAAGGAGGRGDRPGRVLRDLAADHAPRPDVRGGRGDPLLRDEHAGRGPDLLDLRAHQRHPALRARARRPRPGRGDQARSGPAAGRERGRREDHPPGGRRGRGDGVRAARAGARAGAGARRRGGRGRSRGDRRAGRARLELSKRATTKGNLREPEEERQMATATVTKLQNFIDGQFADPAEGRTEPVLNPATGEPIAEAPLSTAEDVDRAVAAAKRAFEGWSAKTPGERSLALLKLADAIEEHADELADLEAANAGKPRKAFYEDEIPFMVDNLRFFAGAARNLEGRASGEYTEGYTSIIRREPVGVVGQITPWN